MATGTVKYQANVYKEGHNAPVMVAKAGDMVTGYVSNDAFIVIKIVRSGRVLPVQYPVSILLEAVATDAPPVDPDPTDPPSHPDYFMATFPDGTTDFYDKRK
jgi:hypothetical protein